MHPGVGGQSGPPPRSSGYVPGHHLAGHPALALKSVQRAYNQDAQQEGHHRQQPSPAAEPVPGLENLYQIAAPQKLQFSPPPPPKYLGHQPKQQQQQQYNHSQPQQAAAAAAAAPPPPPSQYPPSAHSVAAAPPSQQQYGQPHPHHPAPYAQPPHHPPHYGHPEPSSSSQYSHPPPPFHTAQNYQHSQPQQHPPPPPQHYGQPTLPGQQYGHPHYPQHQPYAHGPPPSQPPPPHQHQAYPYHHHLTEQQQGHPAQHPAPSPSLDKGRTHVRGEGLNQLRGDQDLKEKTASEREELAVAWREQMEEKKRQKEIEAARIRAENEKEDERVRREQMDLQKQFEADLARKRAKGEDKKGVVPDRTPPGTPAHARRQQQHDQHHHQHQHDAAPSVEPSPKKPHHQVASPARAVHSYSNSNAGPVARSPEQHQHHVYRAPQAGGGGIDDILAVYGGGGKPAAAPAPGGGVVVVGGGGGGGVAAHGARASINGSVGGGASASSGYDEFGYQMSSAVGGGGGVGNVQRSPAKARGGSNKENSNHHNDYDGGGGRRAAAAVPRNKMPLSKALAAAANGGGAKGLLSDGRPRPPPHKPVFATKGIPTASESRALSKAGRRGGPNPPQEGGGKNRFTRGRDSQAPVAFGRRAVQAGNKEPSAGGGGADKGMQHMMQSLEGESLFLTPGHSLEDIFGGRIAERNVSTTDSPGPRSARAAMGTRPETVAGGAESLSPSLADQVFYRGGGARLSRRGQHAVEELHHLKFPLAPDERGRLDGLLQAFVQAGAA